VPPTKKVTWRGAGNSLLVRSHPSNIDRSTDVDGVPARHQRRSLHARSGGRTHGLDAAEHRPEA
jgi:hypothetical protein